MRKTSPASFQFFSKLICILIIGLFQFPAVSLAFDLKKSDYSPKGVSPKISKSKFPAKNNVSALTVFSNAGSITIADRNNNTVGQPNGISNPYPSQIAVSGLTGTVSDINVAINGFSASRPRDIDVVLVAPTGQALMLMSDTGDLIPTSPGVNITFDDSAGIPVPTGSGSSIPSGTYRPTDFVSPTIGNDNFPPPGPISINRPAPTGASTLASVFNGLSPNGNWSLYAIDDSLGGGASVITGGWSIDIITVGSAVATNTIVTSDINPAQTTQTITFTSTTTEVGSGNPITTGTVSFTQNGNPISGCSAVNLDSSGNAVCMTTLQEGTRTITATYSGTPSFATSNGSLSQVINSPTGVTGSQFCNNGGISIPDLPDSSSPYPSNITASGLVGTINNMTVQLNGLTAARTSNLDFLLVGPGGQAFQMMSDTGDTTTPVSGINLTLDDAAASQLPVGSPLSSGTFRPTDADALNSDPYPAPAPGSFNRAAPTGTATFSSVFGGSNPNGSWALYAVDDGIGGGTSTLSGWCVNFTLNQFSTSTSVTSSQNPSNAGQSVTFTATVTTTGTGTPTGTVQFFDGMTSLGTGMLNGSGQASLTTSALSVGAHNITAQYQGANVGAGGGGYAASTSGVLVQVVLFVDVVPPDTTITANPTDPSGANVSFSFTGSDPGGSGVAGFECSLDGSGFTACTSPQSYTGLSDGSHTFLVRAIDNSNNTDPTPASFTWNVDATAPDTTINSSPANPSNSSNADFTFSSGESGSTFECDLDGGGFTACTSPQNFSGLADGSHTFQVRATDSVGNTDASPATYIWVIDTTAPDTTITANPTNPSASDSASFGFTGSDSGSGVAGFECKLDGGAFAACTSPQNFTGLSDGSHTFQVRAVDNAGNADATPASFTWTVDTTAPDTTITSNPPTFSNSGNASFSFTGTDSGTGVAGFECKLDGGAFSACTSPQTYTGLSNGSHTFQVRAIDAVGNIDTTPASYTWTIDTVAPTVTINQAAGQTDPAFGAGATIHFTAVFSEAVTGFGNSASDVTLSGTAGATNVVVTEIAPFNGTTFDVAVRGMTSDGTVIASIPANAAQDAANNGNAASTSTDNTVTYIQNSPPTIVIVPGGSCGSGASGTINLLIGDATTPTGNLTLSAGSSNTAVVPNANIAFGGSGANRTVTIAAVPQSSIQSSLITVTVSDGQGGTGTLAFTVIAGTNQDNTITGTSGADIIFAGNGKDTVNAGNGNDLVCGGNGKDTINGEGGDDTLYGENGDDTLTGGSGADFFSGGNGPDTFTDFNPGEGDTTDGSLALLKSILKIEWAEE